METRSGDSATALLPEVFFPAASRSFSLLLVTSEGERMQTSARSSLASSYTKSNLLMDLLGQTHQVNQGGTAPPA